MTSNVSLASSPLAANFTGIDSPYEPPEAPDVRLDTTAITAEQAAELLVAELRRRKVLDQE